MNLVGLVADRSVVLAWSAFRLLVDSLEIGQQKILVAYVQSLCRIVEKIPVGLRVLEIWLVEPVAIQPLRLVVAGVAAWAPWPYRFPSIAACFV